MQNSLIIIQYILSYFNGYVFYSFHIYSAAVKPEINPAEFYWWLINLLIIQPSIHPSNKLNVNILFKKYEFKLHTIIRLHDLYDG